MHTGINIINLLLYYYSFNRLSRSFLALLERHLWRAVAVASGAHDVGGAPVSILLALVVRVIPVALVFFDVDTTGTRRRSIILYDVLTIVRYLYAGVVRLM